MSGIRKPMIIKGKMDDLGDEELDFNTNLDDLLESDQCADAIAIGPVVEADKVETNAIPDSPGLDDSIEHVDLNTMMDEGKESFLYP
jgi:hypothetical protein